MARDTIINEIRGLDPEKDHQRIVYLCTCYEFPFDTTRSLELALFRTFCVPKIGGLLDKTGEFQNRPQKRYDDTDIIVSELMEHGYASERGRHALERMNQIHSRFKIGNEEFLYVLSTFVFEPIRWNARFGWRPMCLQERLGMFYFWREVGRRMNIEKLPSSYEDFEQLNTVYEQKHFRYSPESHRVGVAIRDLFVGWFPRLFAPVVRQGIYVVMDGPMLEAFGFPRPYRFMRWLVAAGFKLRASMLRWFWPRRRPRLRTQMKHRTYPHGYDLDKVGPPGRS